jgi:hypothetical protein
MRGTTFYIKKTTIVKNNKKKTKLESNLYGPLGQMKSPPLFLPQPFSPYPRDQTQDAVAKRKITQHCNRNKGKAGKS